MAKSRGSAAKSSSRRCLTRVRVTAPTAPRTPLPTKLAVAEKHTCGFSGARITLIAAEGKEFLRGEDLNFFRPADISYDLASDDYRALDYFWCVLGDWGAQDAAHGAERTVCRALRDRVSRSCGFYSDIRRRCGIGISGAAGHASGAGVGRDGDCDDVDRNSDRAMGALASGAVLERARDDQRRSQTDPHRALCAAPASDLYRARSGGDWRCADI